MPALATRLFSIYALSTLHLQALRGSIDEASSLERHTDLGMCTWWGSVRVYVHSLGGSGEVPEIMRLRSKEKGDELKTRPGGRVFGVEREPGDKKVLPGSFM